jgi:hypothetical protein
MLCFYNYSVVRTDRLFYRIAIVFLPRGGVYFFCLNLDYRYMYLKNLR